MGVGVVKGGGCDLQRRRERKNEFGLARQKLFLGYFADGCNIGAAAAAAKVGVATIYRRRCSDPQFREAFEAAQDSAVANLRAELVRRGLELLRAATPGEQAGPALAGMDAKFLLSLVVHHERSIGRELGDQRPQRSDASEAAARLIKLIARMRAERKRELDRKRRQKAG